MGFGENERRETDGAFNSFVLIRVYSWFKLSHHRCAAECPSRLRSRALGG